ncbi:MAG TPA: sigma-70 domain-containing protein [Polyangiales bacterium]
MTDLRPELAAIVERLLARHEQVVDLDSLADEIGVAAVNAQEIDAMLSALEHAGRSVGGPAASGPSAGLGQVLGAARRLRAELGRTPSATEIAASENLELSTVRTALLFARIVQR